MLDHSGDLVFLFLIAQVVLISVLVPFAMGLWGVFLHGYSDADWAVKHSTMGFVFMMHSAAISWGSKKQSSISLSTCEAEIMAASEAAKEALHLTGASADAGEPLSEPMRVYVDNKAAIDLAYNPEHHQRTKHIERRHFYVRELVEDLKITVPFVASADNLADFFTKPLHERVFFPMRDRIMNVRRPAD